MSEHLYFIAIVPPSPIQQEINHFKQHMASRYGSKHALNAPPHITLHMPFRWKNKKLDRLTDVMNQLNDQLNPFEVELKDFDFFEPRVVFVNVVENLQLENLQKRVVDVCRKQLKLDNGNYKNQVFRPHITIGFRDLKKSMFYEAKEEFEKRVYGCEFRVNEIKLLRHDRLVWKIINSS